MGFRYIESISGVIFSIQGQGWMLKVKLRSSLLTDNELIFQLTITLLLVYLYTEMDTHTTFATFIHQITIKKSYY
jgi:hypothetical protein